jgi:hypothetical protein
MKHLIPAVLIAIGLGAVGQAPGHPFDAASITASLDSFVLVTPVTGPKPVGYVVQTIARDRDNNLRVAVDYDLGPSAQRVEMLMHGRTLAPIGHWEGLTRRGRAGQQLTGEVRFRDGRASGAYILSKRVFDIPLDTGRAFTFRTFASPGQVELTRVKVEAIDTVSVPAGVYEAYRLRVIARDTSAVFISTITPRRTLLVRLANGSSEMQLKSHR